MLIKLSNYGIRGTALGLIKSYLNNGNQYVTINGHPSNYKLNIGGVPQGSILGSLLFYLYVSDIFNITTDAHCIIHVDDTSLLFRGDDPFVLERNINRTLSEVQKWSKVYSLESNSNKTKAVVFTPRNKSIGVNLSLHLSSQKIEFVH